MVLHGIGWLLIHHPRVVGLAILVLVASWYLMLALLLLGGYAVYVILHAIGVSQLERRREMEKLREEIRALLTQKDRR
jgi:hypothetical protein